MASSTAWARAAAMWGASCACCNPAIYGVTPPGCCSAPWPCWWRWASWEVSRDEPPRRSALPSADRVRARARRPARFGPWQPRVCAGKLTRYLRRLARPASLLRPHGRGRAVRDRPAVDRHSQHSLRHLRERCQPVARAALHLPHPALRIDLLELPQGSLQGVLRLPAAVGIRPDRRLSGAGPLPLL